MTMTRTIPGPRSPQASAGTGFASFAVHDGIVTAYAADSFIRVESADGRIGRYRLTPSTRVDQARMTSARPAVTVGARVYLTARIERGEAVATTIRLAVPAPR